MQLHHNGKVIYIFENGANFDSCRIQVLNSGIWVSNFEILGVKFWNLGVEFWNLGVEFGLSNI